MTEENNLEELIQQIQEKDHLIVAFDKDSSTEYFSAQVQMKAAPYQIAGLIKMLLEKYPEIGAILHQSIHQEQLLNFMDENQVQ